MPPSATAFGTAPPERGKAVMALPALTYPMLVSPGPMSQVSLITGYARPIVTTLWMPIVQRQRQPRVDARLPGLTKTVDR